MSDSSQHPHSTPPETSPIRRSLFQRLREYLAYGSGHPAPFYPTFDPFSEKLRIAEPEWVRESRASLEAQNDPQTLRAEIEDLRARLVRYRQANEEIGLALSHARQNEKNLREANKVFAERDGNRKADLENAQIAYERCEKTLAEEREKLRAATDRADVLNAAIRYVCSISANNAATDWLYEWNEGDEDADNELREWINGPGKEVLGETVARRVGMPPVSPPVGRERPEPAPMQRPGDLTPYTYKGEPPPVPVHAPPLSPDRMCSAFNMGFNGRWCSRDREKYASCAECPGNMHPTR